MDKITCIAYILYDSSNSQEIKEKAIQLLNGDISLHELKKNTSIIHELVMAEAAVKKGNVNKGMVQDFADQFLQIEA